MHARCAAGGAGRGGKEGNIIGDVINHGKKQYWLVPGTHYHATLQRGENTLNAQVRPLLKPGLRIGDWHANSHRDGLRADVRRSELCRVKHPLETRLLGRSHGVKTAATPGSPLHPPRFRAHAQVARLLARTLAAEGAYSPGSFLRAYVDFMTTPGSHNDVYAETYHRSEWRCVLWLCVRCGCACSPAAPVRGRMRGFVGDIGMKPKAGLPNADVKPRGCALRQQQPA
jgi:hypothetical protein